MSKVLLPSSTQWGHHSRDATSDEIVEGLTTQTAQAIREFSALLEGPEQCRDRDSYFRVSITIPLTRTLFDQLMNGATGYRAQYSVSIEAGEDFNRRLIEAIAPIIVVAEQLYKDRFDRLLCSTSLLGPFSKFWYPKELTDPSAQTELLKFKEELRISRWIEYWSAMAKPRKGLLAPVPENMSLLLNGTFVNKAGGVYEQKPTRSRQIYDTGWT
jgi:hypothetical protein